MYHASGSGGVLLSAVLTPYQPMVILLFLPAHLTSMIVNLNCKITADINYYKDKLPGSFMSARESHLVITNQVFQK